MSASGMTRDDMPSPPPAASPDPATLSVEAPSADSAIYQPPAGAQATDQLDASVDGTSASHYGANDPALYDTQQDTPQDD
jgi:hypothetical protein